MNDASNDNTRPARRLVPIVGMIVDDGRVILTQAIPRPPAPAPPLRLVDD